MKTKNFYPIVFTGNMVRAILDGHKTQTRRRIQNADPLWRLNPANNLRFSQGEVIFTKESLAHGPSQINRRCKYGKVGTVLWVQEFWQVVRGCLDHETGGEYDVQPWDHILGDPRDYLNGDARFGLCADIYYKADGEEVNPGAFYPLIGIHGETLRKPEIGWQPAIMQPRWAARIELEIVSLRVEPLQAISEGDAVAEGFIPRRQLSCGGDASDPHRRILRPLASHARGRLMG